MDVLARPGSRVARALPEVLGALRAGGTAPRVLNTAPGAVEACELAIADGTRAIVAVGGDGTVHLAVQALAHDPRTDGVQPRASLGIVPLGTGNDLADALGAPSDPVAAARAIATDVVTGTSRRIDAVRATPGGWYAAILSIGFDAAVNSRANRMRWPRGPRRYDLAILLELARMRRYQLTLDVDGDRFETPALLAAFGNTRSYGGGMRMCPDADPSDGLLDVTIVEPVSRTELILVKPRLYTGTHVDHPRVRTHRARRVEIAADHTEAYADGEPFGRPPLTIECVPSALPTVGTAG